MTWKSNPNDAGEEYPPFTPGVYPYKVDTIEEKTFSTGSEGWKLKLLVDTGRADRPCFTNLVNTPKALFKMREFLKSVGRGEDFKHCDDGLNIWNYEGLTGQGDFYENERGYLECKSFIEAKEQTASSPGNSPVERPTVGGPATSGAPREPGDDSYDYGPPPALDDQIPF